jgi:flagellar hook-associated protein 1
MALSNLMSIARSALLVHQRSLDVTGHNIANANTPGYSRQRLVLQAEVPLRTPLGTVGRGVTAGGTTAMRDAFLDAAFRREQGIYAQADTLRQMLQRVEDVLQEPSENGLGATLDAMFGAFADLADRPTSGAARVGVRAAADAVARQLNTLDARLASEEGQLQAAYRDTVDRINSIARQVADLNREIVAAGSPPRSAPDLEDARGLLLDELSGLIGVRVLERGDGSVGVMAGDVLLVDGAYSQTLEARLLVGGGIGAGVVGSTRLLVPGSGSLRALGELATEGVKSIRVELDRLAAELVPTINAIHQGGTTLGGDTGVSLFDPAGVTAATIRLSAAVAGSADQVVAGTGLAGDNSVALALAALRTEARAALNGDTPGGFYASVATSLATIVRDADQGARTAEVILSGARSRRAAVSGVSTDEEMVALIQQQQAFAAAARLVSVADEVLQEVLRLV